MTFPWQGRERGERRSWAVRLTQDLNDWELNVVMDFLHILESNIPSTDNGVHMRWKLKRNGDFDIRLFYNELRCSSSVVFSLIGIWKVKAPQCVSFFVWTVAWDKILRGDNLRHRGFDFVDWCVMCCCCGETVDHF